MLALTTGLRPSELFGLHWESIHLKMGILPVRPALEERDGKVHLKERKNEAGRRQIELSAMGIKAHWYHAAIQLVKGRRGCPYVIFDSGCGFLRKCRFHLWGWFKVHMTVRLEKTTFTRSGTVARAGGQGQREGDSGDFRPFQHQYDDGYLRPFDAGFAASSGFNFRPFARIGHRFCPPSP